METSLKLLGTPKYYLHDIGRRYHVPVRITVEGIGADQRMSKLLALSATVWADLRKMWFVKLHNSPGLSQQQHSPMIRPLEQQPAF